MIEALGQRYGLAGPPVRQLETLLDYVAAHPRAPTAVTDRAGILREHLADSLVALELPVVRTATMIADLGSGAGFPGLPIAIALATSQVSLVESNRGKCEFITGAIEACGMLNAMAVHSRAETWADGRRRCDLVTARAVAPLAVVAEYAAPLLKLGGTLVVWRGRRDDQDEAAGARAAAMLGLEPGPVVKVEPYPGALHRHLHTIVKVAPTPDRFPRRPGMARKRPLVAPAHAASDRAQR